MGHLQFHRQLQGMDNAVSLLPVGEQLVGEH